MAVPKKKPLKNLAPPRKISTGLATVKQPAKNRRNSSNIDSLLNTLEKDKRNDDSDFVSSLEDDNA